MRVRLDMYSRSPHRWNLTVLIGGLLVIGFLSIIPFIADHGEPESAREPSRVGRAHPTVPDFDVRVVGESSVVVTNLAGWTQEQVRIYLHELKKANAKGALASVGIPAPSTSHGYAQGVVYLIDGHPEDDLLAQFARKLNPGYALIAPRVRGVYQWPPDRLVARFASETVLDE